MWVTGGMETGFIGLAVAISTLETLVDKGIITKADTANIISSARNELKAAGSSVALSTAVATVEAHLLPRFGKS